MQWMSAGSTHSRLCSICCVYNLAFICIGVRSSLVWKFSYKIFRSSCRRRREWSAQASVASMTEQTTGESTAPSRKKVAFAALQHRDFRGFFVTTMLAMMADNIEHVVSYWLLFQKFHSPVLAGFADISHWTPFLLLSVYFGGIADRYDCRKIIQTAQIMYMGVSVVGHFVLHQHDSSMACLRTAGDSWHRRSFVDARRTAGDS